MLIHKLVRLVYCVGIKKMSNKWPLQDAKARLSELVKKAQNNRPQFISIRGNPAVVVISVEEYEALTIPATNIVEFLRQSPLVGLELDLARDKSTNRDISL